MISTNQLECLNSIMYIQFGKCGLISVSLALFSNLQVLSIVFLFQVTTFLIWTPSTIKFQSLTYTLEVSEMFTLSILYCLSIFRSAGQQKIRSIDCASLPLKCVTNQLVTVHRTPLILSVIAIVWQIQTIARKIEWVH